MEKEIIELIKSLAGSAETAVIWYFALDLAKHVVGWCGSIGLAYVFFRGLNTVFSGISGKRN
ncbi:MAG: hypothetical protein ACKO0Z_02795 [Betaproteobacteria bacterium]